MSRFKFLVGFCALILVLTGCAMAPKGTVAPSETATPSTTATPSRAKSSTDPMKTVTAERGPKAKVRITLAGDSTVTNDAGWGFDFALCLTDEADCVNQSRGGRSSKSFYDEKRWEACLKSKPDYVLIQFGHNDEPGKGPERETDPNTTYRANMIRYVDEARAAGIKPVLVTSISRRQFKEGKIKSSLTPYAEVVKKIAAEKNVPLIDLHALSIEVYNKLGKEGCWNAFSPKKEDGTWDNTHFDARGGALFGPIVAKELKKVVPELAPYIRDTPKEVSVAPDGTGQFKTVQEAIAALPDNSKDRIIVRIAPGVYRGQCILPKTKTNVTFLGEDATSTILTYNLNVSDPVPPGDSDKYKGTGVVILGAGFRAEKITFENTSGNHGQAMAMRIESDRAVIRDCRFLGWQDTLLVSKNRQYFRDCHIEGRVDFIYGGSTAVFDHCRIHSKNGGHITAASTPKENPYGYVFIDCDLTGDPTPCPDPKDSNYLAQSTKPPMADLGRPWRPYASVVYMNCRMGDHIKPAGWDNWRKAENEKTARYAEYNNSGPGANTSNRVSWAKQLSKAEAGKITVEAVLAGTDGWNPNE